MTSISPVSPFRSDILKGKVALITGGGTGICQEISWTLGTHGAILAIMGRREDVLKETCKLFSASHIECCYIKGDVRDLGSAMEAVKKVSSLYGRLDILINGAAGNFLCAAEDLSSNAFRSGTFHMCKASFEELKKTKGCIINISATLTLHAIDLQLHATAAKAGVDVLTRNLSTEWGPYGIRVNGVAPGFIQGTEGIQRLSTLQLSHSEQSQSESLLRKSTETIPLRRLGHKRDIGLACLFLISTGANYITGETLVVDGGQWLAHSWVSREDYDRIKSLRLSKSKL